MGALLGRLVTFTYRGFDLVYFDQPYNDTRRNERAIELAIAFHWLHGRRGRGLEVGNVLAHYGATGHRVVDLNEQGDGVENLDVFAINGGYDWIVSISTVEHVGRDAEPRSDALAIDAIRHLESLLKPDGAMLITVPGGYNPTLDAALPTIGTTHQATYVRDGDGWYQTERPAFLPYGSSTPWAESVWIGEW
jgi:hypothetical protein